MVSSSSNRATGLPIPIVSGQVRYIACLSVGILGGLAAWLLAGGWLYGLLAAVIAQALLYVVWTMLTLTPMDGGRTRDHALKEDLGRALSDLAVLLIMAASLAVVVIMLFLGKQTRVIDACLAISSILVVWGMLHLMYAARYARLYYVEDHGGIDFNSHELPRYTDFFYFAFTLGMTYAVSDCNVTSGRVRAVVLRHAVLSYVFGTMVLACAINLVLNLAA